MAKLTKNQSDALAEIADGRPHGFGYGSGSYRVALRSLSARIPPLVIYEWAKRPIDETFTITDAGRAAIGLPIGR